MNVIIVIHKEDFMRNGSFDRNHTAPPLVPNNASLTPRSFLENV